MNKVLSVNFKTKMFFEEDAVYHIYNRSNEKLFYSRENYLFFLTKIKNIIAPSAHIFAWVLMPNHFHLLIEATKESCINVAESHRPDLQLLSKNIGTVLSSYPQAINRQEGRRGNLFAHKTKAKMLNEAYYSGSASMLPQRGQIDYATACFLYIHQNPVMAGLVSNPEDWEFSSFLDYAGLRDGKLVNKEIAHQYIDVDFSNFREQSMFLLEEELLKQLI